MASAWRSQDGSQQHSRKERLPCDLETGSLRPNNWQWDFHKAPLCPRSSTMSTQRDWRIWTAMVTLADNGFIYKTASGISTAVRAVQEQLEKVSHWCQETESEINPSKAQALWCTLNNKAVGQAVPAVSFNGEAIKHTNSLRYLGIHFDRMLIYVQDAGRINKTQVQERTVRVKSHGFKRHQTTSSVPTASKCDTQRHWLWSGSHNPVTV